MFFHGDCLWLIWCWAICNSEMCDWGYRRGIRFGSWRWRGSYEMGWDFIYF